MPTRSLDSLTLLGFKSHRALDEFSLTQRNVLIGAHASGKTNLLDFFRLLRALARDDLRDFVARSGGGEGLLFRGPRQPGAIEATLMFGDNSFRVRLQPTASDELMVKDIALLWMPDQEWRVFPRGRAEAGISVWADHRLPDAPERLSRDGEVHAAIAGWSVHHFADTAPMRRAVDPADHHELAEDGGNLAAVLADIRSTHPAAYQQILAALQQLVPDLDDLHLEPAGPDDLVRLQWRQTGDTHLFQPAQLADGALRFLALATVLLQPEPPATLVLDEPDLGLHPLALRRLAGLLHAASARAQLIIATQSPELVRTFAPDDIILVERRHGASELRRMTAPALAEWRKQHDPGELIAEAAAP